MPPDLAWRSNEYSPWSPSGCTHSPTGSMTPSTVACVVAINLPISTSSQFADLPERVLAGDRVVVSECPEVAAPDLDSLALDRRSGDRRLRNATAAGDEV